MKVLSQTISEDAQVEDITNIEIHANTARLNTSNRFDELEIIQGEK